VPAGSLGPPGLRLLSTGEDAPVSFDI
jgi:hypothetical protein